MIEDRLQRAMTSLYVFSLKNVCLSREERMNEIDQFVEGIARFFQAKLGSSLLDAYKLGSLAHGGFSDQYSDIDFGLLLHCAQPPSAMTTWIDEAKTLDAVYSKKLSVFWGNPDHNWGRLPHLDRLDLLDHGIPLLNAFKPQFRRPDKEEIRAELLRSIERSWKPRLPELNRLAVLAAENRKPYIRAILYAARLIYSWDNLRMDSNDSAVAYLHQVQPAGLDLDPIDMAVMCRQGRCSAEDVFAVGPDLVRQSDAAIKYISARP
jgi:predicted nucleotidyltransferase